MLDQDIHLRDYIRVILKRRYPVYTFFVIVMILITLGTYTATPVYQGTIKILIEKAELYSLTEFGFTPHDPEFYSTQYQLIRSHLVAQKVVERLYENKVFRDYFILDSSSDLSFGKKISHGVRSMFSKLTGDNLVSNELSDEEKKEEIITSVMENISVNPLKNTRIVSIGFHSRNPNIAALVVNDVAKAYVEALLDLRVSTSKHALSWMTKKVGEERNQLAEAEQSLQRYMQNNDIVTLEDRITIVPQKLSELSTQLTRAETKRKEIETLYLKTQSIKGTDAIESILAVSMDSTVVSLRAQILKSEQHLSELSKKYGSKHPQMIKAKDELKELKKKKLREITRVIASIKNQFEFAMSNEQNLRNHLGETKAEALSLNEKFIQYGVLKRNVDTGRQLFDSLLKRLKEQSINEEVQMVNVMLLEQAAVPKFPVKPNKKMNLLIGIFIGIMGGILLAFFIEYFDNTIKSPDDAESKLGIPVLGMVSHLSASKQETKQRQIERIVLDEPRSTFTENYKALRTSVMLSSAEFPPKTILVTSMAPSEGKTSTSINLALAIAQSDSKVLLVDADLRRPRVHKIFNLNNKVGLSTFLAGTSTKVLKEGPLPNLNVITSGPIPPNPSELLSSEKFAHFMATMRDKYDVVIFDSSPVLSVTDSLILGKMVDGVIIVSRAGKTSYEMVTKGIKLFGDMNANVLGLLINAIDMRKGSYYYYTYHDYHYYHYGSSYGDDEKEMEKDKEKA